MSMTRTVAEFVATARLEQFSEREVTVARHSILDWFGVSLAALNEPLTEVLLALDDSEGPEQASVIGSARRRPVAAAATINGAMGHALDYDDVSVSMRGHPTVPVFPAVLAMSEARHIDGASLLQAFIVGSEICIRFGDWLGDPHVARGWHSTGTAGTLGAAMGCAKLIGLASPATATAFGIAASSLGGLKANFGTMCKPLHAGNAAAAGIFAARLAEKGFTASQTILDQQADFAEAMGSNADEGMVTRGLGTNMLRDVVYKFHAACYGTHAPIEAALAARRTPGFKPSDVNSAQVEIDARHARICNIQAPKTGLEAKFSLSFTTAMTLAGVDMSKISNYNDDVVKQADLIDLQKRVDVRFVPDFGRLKCRLTLGMSDGRTLETLGDVSEPLTDLAEQGRRISRKFHSLADPVIGADKASLLEGLINDIAGLKDVSDLGRACAVLLPSIGRAA